VLAVTQRALRVGALQPIPTEFEFLEDHGMQFLVRIVSRLARKPRPADSGGKERTRNPFLPYDPELYVADASDSHVCLLNKFNVVDHHLLIVTRQFEHQDEPLNLRDFEALGRCLAEYDGLGFYNGGTVAGASQPHKHLQMIPLPLAPTGPRVPIEAILHVAELSDGVRQVSGLPYPHAVAGLNAELTERPAEAAHRAWTLYRTMLQALGLGPVSEGGRPSGPYNLLAARQWMMVVPRTQECFQSISLNAMAFAGAFLVRDEQQMSVLKEHGPMTALRTVTSHAGVGY
jgi:ATP adenylyltransferase